MLGPDHSVVATSLDNLAVILALEKQYAEAETLYARSLAICDREDAASLHNLAMVEEALDRPKEAEPLYKRMLTIADRPEAKPKELASLLREYAEVLRKSGRPAQAAKLDARAAALEKQPAPRM